MTVIDDYLNHASPTQKAELERIREIVKQIAPDAEEVISYGVPAFKVNKRVVLYMGAFKDHMSIFPASDAMIAEIGEDVAQFRAAKGTLRFTEDKPIPGPILTKIVTYLLASRS